MGLCTWTVTGTKVPLSASTGATHFTPCSNTRAPWVRGSIIWATLNNWPDAMSWAWLGHSGTAAAYRPARRVWRNPSRRVSVGHFMAWPCWARTSSSRCLPAPAPSKWFAPCRGSPHSVQTLGTQIGGHDGLRVKAPGIGDALAGLSSLVLRSAKPTKDGPSAPPAGKPCT